MATTRKKPRSKAQFQVSRRLAGQLRFGLVSFEVQAINAEIKENAEVHFHCCTSLTTSGFTSPKYAQSMAR